MITEGLSAYLLHSRLMKGSSVQTFFLTREAGLIRAFCAGGRSKSKRAILQPFTPLWLTLKTKHFGTFVDKVEIAAPTHPLTSDALIAGLYLNELLYRVLKPESSDSELFAAFDETLKALVHADSMLALLQALRRFELNLIGLLGYGVSFRHDARSHEAIIEDGTYGFIPKEGFVMASSGLEGKHIIAIAQGLFEDKAVLDTAKKITRLAIDDVLDGQEIKTRALYSHTY